MFGTSKRYLVGLLVCLIPFQFAVFATGFGGSDGDKQKAKERIIRHPYIASIRNFGRYDCTGILIGDRAVMTAAQCVDIRYDRSLLPEIWLNSSTTFEPSEGTVHRQAVDIRLHPNYTGDAYDGYDIAVLLLNDTTKPLRPIRFNKNWILYEGGSLSILGYGRSSGSGSTSPVLLIGEVRIVEPGQCINSKDIVYLENRTICVEGSVPCDGDQGGPVIVNNQDPLTDVLVGIISATSCADNQRTASIQSVTDESSAGWVIDQVEEWDAFGTTGCSADVLKDIGESLADAPQALLDDFWEEFLDNC